MKTFLLTILAVCIQIVSSAQSTHLQFKGFPIDGTVTEFVQNMQSVGYELIGEENGTAVLRGDFAGSKNCLIMTSQNRTVENIHSVAVCFSPQTSWTPLWYEYKDLKEKLTQKYGKPVVCKEKFPVEVENDQEKYFLLKFEGYNYVSSFNAPGGNVDLTIENVPYIGCVVKLQYWDAINSAKLEEQAVEDL